MKNIACSLSLVPTFEPYVEREECDFIDEDEPQQTQLYDPESMHYIFLIDRSGSMSGSRIEKAKNALILFIQSMPANCRFSIISFGSQHQYLEIEKD